MVTEKTDYKDKLDALPPEERDAYTGRWRVYLGGLPRSQYISEITKLTQQMGPEFASSLVQPDLDIEKPQAPPIEQLPAIDFEAETPWYAKPFEWAIEQPVIGPAIEKGLEGWNRYREGYITPAAMNLAKTYSPELREQLGGASAFKYAVKEREKIWEESDLPWLAKIAPELLVDPTSYFGWGLGSKAVTAMAGKAGLKGLSKALKPFAEIEEAYIRASGAPIRATGRVLKKIPDIPLGTWRGKPRKLGALFQESPRTAVSNEALNTFDVMRNMEAAGLQVGKHLSQILDDMAQGIVDPLITNTITNPRQKAVLGRMLANPEKLGLDELSRVIDDYPEKALTILGRRTTSALAKELGQTVPAKQMNAISMSKDMYGLWKRTVLSTPWYVEQNIVENFIRPIMVGTNPLMDIKAIVASPIFKRFPIDMQRRALTLAERWTKKIPENIEWARSVSTGGLTEAMAGALATGKKWPTLTIGATLDEQAMLRVFKNQYDLFHRKLMQNTSPETARALSELDKLFDDVLKSNTMKVVVEPDVIRYLRDTSIPGSTDDALDAFRMVQRNRTMAIASPKGGTTEAGLPDRIRSTIREELPRHWARNDTHAIDRMFDRLEQSLPEQMQTYQKQALLQRVTHYRKLIRQQVPKQYQSMYNDIIKRFRYDRATDRAAQLEAAKTLGAFEAALFRANVESQREMESLILSTVIMDSIATKQYANIGTYVGIHDQITKAAFKAGDTLTDKTFYLSKTIKFAKDPKKVTDRWNEYIMAIQSEFPDQADILARSVPDTEVLWSTRRKIQDLRWSKVSRDEFTAMNINVKLPTQVDASGKLITMEDYLQTQKSALKSWKGRVDKAWTKRHESPKAKNEVLDTLRDETIRIKEKVALQELKVQNEAMDMASDIASDTFGNYGVRTNLDDLMQNIGMPFWFFPSRSIPFYARQALQKPRLGVEIMQNQKQAEEANLPTRLHGYIPIPNTNYYYSPVAASMLWQLVGQYDWTPSHLGGLEQGQLEMSQKLGMSFGPQWAIATTLVSRLIESQGGRPFVVGEPKYIIPQHRWLEAVENLDLPGLSQIAGIVSEPFDMFLRAVYGTEVAEWQQREVEKYMVDSGVNPQDASKEEIQIAWKQYWTRQLISIPGGVVKELTPTEKARFDMMGEKAKELGLDKSETAALRRAGESPWAGLRQDQLETLFADIPAQKLNRYIRPLGLTSESRPIWEDYIRLKLERETLRGDPDDPAPGSRIYVEQQLDKRLASTGQDRISPRMWKALYRQNYNKYVNAVSVLEERVYKLAPKTEADWDAYRELLGRDKPVRHPDDVKLDEYYKEMDSGEFTDAIGAFDYDAFRIAETNFFEGMAPSTVEYIQNRRNRYKTPTRMAYTRDMEQAQIYYDLQDQMLAEYPPEIAQLIEYASSSPDPAIQRAILIGNPQAMLVMRRIRLAKKRLRLERPELDRILRFWNS